MTIVTLGRVKKLTNDQIELEDVASKQLIKGWVGNGSLDTIVGTEGIFVGDFIADRFTFKRVHEKKFLAPLYEDELLKIGSIINLYDEALGPFDELWKKLKSNL